MKTILHAIKNSIINANQPGESPQNSAAINTQPIQARVHNIVKNERHIGLFDNVEQASNQEIQYDTSGDFQDNNIVSIKPIYTIMREYCIKEYGPDWKSFIQKYNENTEKATAHSIVSTKEIPIDPRYRGLTDNKYPIIDIDWLEQNQIDPSYVLVFRRTNSIDIAKPERFWHVDARELIKKFGELRNAETIIVSTLDHIMKTGGGCVQDSNYGEGLSPLQVRELNFDKSGMIGYFDRSDALTISNT